VTRIDFYTQVQDKHELVRKLCSKALATRARLLLWVADREACQRLSKALWTLPSTGFVPHVAATDPLAAVTPIIVDSESGPFPHDDVLVNLRPEVPPFFSRFRRLIEIVAVSEEEEVRLARERFRFYRDRGYALETHNMSALQATP
jgi:DNA polymerase III subunit chi